MVNVFIIEDHESMRNGLSFIVDASEKYKCIGTAASAETGLKAIRNNPPDIVLMDINLPGKSGIDCTSELLSEFPKMRILICTVLEDDDKIFRALAAGASGYILKKSSPQQIIESMDEMMLGGSPISSRVARKMVDFFQQNNKKVELEEKLTDRELEILQLLTLGFRNKEIGDKLFISIPTVKTHIYNIYRKLHVQSRIAAVNVFNSMRGFNSPH